MRNHTLVVVGTKGGTGKSTVASQMLPLLFIEDEVKINVLELDNNNKTQLSSSLINIESYKTEGKDIVGVLDGVSFSLDVGEDVVNIIDVGGGADTIQILNYLKRTKVSGCKYIIPTNSDPDQKKNVTDTIAMIKKIEEEPDICVCLNRCKKSDLEDIKQDFSYIFDKKGNPILPDIHIWHISDSRIFNMLKQDYQVVLADIYAAAKSLISNDLKIAKREWAKKGKEFYIEQIEKFRFFQDCIEIANEVELLRSFVFKDTDEV